jgi:hypothetical protein
MKVSDSSEREEENAEGHQNVEDFRLLIVQPCRASRNRRAAVTALLLVGVFQTPPIPKQENIEGLQVRDRRRAKGSSTDFQVFD